MTMRMSPSCAVRGAIGHRLVLAVALLAAMAVRGEEAYSFAIVPQFDQRKLFAIWKPVAEQLEARTGLKLELVGSAGVSEFERRLGAGEFDFAYTNPYLILKERERQGYIPLVRDATPLRGILVVAKDGPIHEVSELDGKLLAVPSPNALGASLLLRAELERLHHVTMRMLDVKSHSSVYLHVASGLAEAGGGVEKTFQGQTPTVRERLRIIYTTAEMPSHPVAAHPRVPEKDREKMRRALLELATTTPGLALLSAIPMTRPVAASLDDYQVMAGWHLERLWVEGAQ